MERQGEAVGTPVELAALAAVALRRLLAVSIPCELLRRGSTAAVGLPWAETSSGSAATRSIIAPAPVTRIM